MIALQKIEQLNPQDNEESRIYFLSNFDWTLSTLDSAARKPLDDSLVEIFDLLAKHRFDIGISIDFKVKMTLIDESPAYIQSLPTPNNLEEELTVGLVLLHEYGIIITVPFSKNANPTFAQRKPNGNLRLLVD